MGQPRINISVSESLRERMREAGDVNWSAVAQEAFEKKLGEIAAARKEKDVKDVIQRLRATKIAGESDDTRRGFERGVEWAKHQATWADLETVAAFADDDTSLQGARLNPYEQDLMTALLHRRHGPSGTTPQDVDFVAEELFGKSDPTAADAQGFVDGALSVYDEVKGQL